MDSICKFLPTKNYTGNLKTVHFVYETDFKSLKQPFIRPIYYAHIVTSGEAILRFAGRCEKLSVGTVFFFMPAVPYEIDGNEDFSYIYISFMGSCVPELLDSMKIGLDRCVFKGHSQLCDIWINSIVRISDLNSNILTESMLLYALSFLAPSDLEEGKSRHKEELFELIADYVDMHFRDPDLTLRRVADVFAYTEKYLSHLFKKNMKVGFASYLTNLRIQYALKLISDGVTSVSEIAVRSGYSDPLYFSKVFKKTVGHAPSEYISSKKR